MKRKLFLGLIGLLCFSFMSCQKVISEEVHHTKATVVKVYHRAAYTTYVHSGKVRTIVHHPAKNITYFEADVDGLHLEGQQNNRALYNACKDNIGCELDALYDITVYEQPDKTQKIVYSNLRVIWEDYE